MRSQLAAQFMPFFRLIARILTFRDKKYRILTFRDKKYRILTFCDKTELYLTVLQQNNVEACLRCEASLSLALSGLLSCSLWLPLARSCSLRLPIALRICVQHPRSAHKALAQLAAALLRCNTFCCSAYIYNINNTFNLCHISTSRSTISDIKYTYPIDPIAPIDLIYPRYLKHPIYSTRSLGALLAGGPLGLLTSSFVPFGRSGRVTHASVIG